MMLLRRVVFPPRWRDQRYDLAGVSLLRSLHEGLNSPYRVVRSLTFSKRISALSQVGSMTPGFLWISSGSPCNLLSEIHHS